MSKVRNFSEIAPNIAFPEFNFYELYYSTFEKSELGRIKKLLPLREMSRRLGIHRPRTKFLDVRRLTYRKLRKHSRNQTRKITRRLFDLLGKILKEIREIEKGQGGEERRVRSEGQQHIGRRDIVH